MTLIATLILLGIVFYLINLIPMSPFYQEIIRVLSILITIAYILQFFGVNIGLPTIR